MESHQLPYRNSYIHYLRLGRGTQVLFCFHGYGEDATSFRFLENALGHDYTLYALELPFHGQTEWNELLELTATDLKEIINNIIPLDLQTISILGYSMGGRIAMALLQDMPEKIERVVLVAPDGLHKNFWYWLSTQTQIGNNVFRYTMRKPHWFFYGMQLLMKVGLMNKSIFKFAHSYLDNDQERNMLYKRWTTMRKFNPNEKRMSAALQQHRIPLRMLFGSYDRIILPKRSTNLDKQNDTIHVKTIKAGHQLLKPKYAKDIAALFYE